MSERKRELPQSFRFAVRGRASDLSEWQDGCKVGDQPSRDLQVSGAAPPNGVISREQSLLSRAFFQENSETEHAPCVAGRPVQETFHDHSNLRELISTGMPSRITGVTYEDIVCYMNAVDALTVSRFGVTHRELMEIQAETEREMKMVRAHRESGRSRLMLASSVDSSVNLSNTSSTSENEPENASTAGHKPAKLQRVMNIPNLEQEQGRSRSDSSLLCSNKASDGTFPMVCLPTQAEVKNQIGQKSRCRRMCAVPGCPNGVVQGGVCISHGAKRKTCGIPGCTKPVKKHGKCSAHGPKRQLCKAEGCTKVSVRGGKCHTHGAQRRTCAIEGCPKQPTVGDMCKRHHDSLHGISKVYKSRKRKVSESEGDAVKNDPNSSPLQKNDGLG